MPGRNASSGDYRYGYNKGSEKDDEITGITGSHITTEFRMLDTRIAKWWSIDPKTKELPHQSPYNSMDNNPILLNDEDGGCTTCPSRTVRQRLTSTNAQNVMARVRTAPVGGGQLIFQTNNIVANQNVRQNAVRATVFRDKLNPLVKNRPDASTVGPNAPRPSLANGAFTRSVSQLTQELNSTTNVDAKVKINVRGLRRGENVTVQFVDPTTGNVVGNTQTITRRNARRGINVQKVRGGLANVRITNNSANGRVRARLNSKTNIFGVKKTKSRIRRGGRRIKR